MAIERSEDRTTAAHPSVSGSVTDQTQRMYDEILASLKEYRLPPGVRLREEKLASMFDVSRTQVRKVLQRLEFEGLVRREPRRGAMVAAPDRDETRDIFEARRLIEPWVVSRLCEHCTKSRLSALRRIVREEQKAQREGDRRSVVRLSGEFHQALAQAAGNRALAKSVDELSVRTCLAILANQAPLVATCRDDEHADIVDAIERGDARTAARLMVAHLDHIESSLEQPDLSDTTDSLEAAFAERSRGVARNPRGKA